MLYTVVLVTTGKPTPSPSVDPFALAIKEFAGYGIVGIVAIILAIVAYRGWKNDQERWKDTLDRERARADRAEAANTDLNREMREKVMPLLAEVARANGELVREVRESSKSIAELAWIRDNEKRGHG